MEQRTEEWFAERIGKVTASRVSDVVARTKSGYSASRANYMAELVCERLTGKRKEGFITAAMQWGIDQEIVARDAYSIKTGVLVTEVGFIPHPSIKMSGASPDGLIAPEGCVEIKCPNTATHIEWLLTPEPPQEYFLQMQWQMACAGAEWCDWVSYDSRMPEHLQLLVVRVPRDDDVIKTLENEIYKFLVELETKVNKLKELAL
jgi:putative phage-type endonuclease